MGTNGQEAEVPLDELERLAAPFGTGVHADSGTPDLAGVAKESSIADKDSGIGGSKPRTS